MIGLAGIFSCWCGGPKFETTETTRLDLVGLNPPRSSRESDDATAAATVDDDGIKSKIVKFSYIGRGGG